MRQREYYVFISPDGKRYEGYGIRLFAETHKLDQANMHHVHTGERSHHKGWTSEIVEVNK